MSRFLNSSQDFFLTSRFLPLVENFLQSCTANRKVWSSLTLPLKTEKNLDLNRKILTTFVHDGLNTLVFNFHLRPQKIEKSKIAKLCHIKDYLRHYQKICLVCGDKYFYLSIDFALGACERGKRELTMWFFESFNF